MENYKNKQFLSFKSHRSEQHDQSHTTPLSCPERLELSLCPVYIRAVYITFPLVTQQPSLLSDQLSWYHSAYAQVTLILIMAPEHNNDVGNSSIVKRSCKVLPLREKECIYRKKHSIQRVQYYLQFQASSGGPGTYPPWISEDYSI